MKLNQLITSNDERVIESLMVDSRKKMPASMFFCIEGLTSDAHNFVDQAIENGAVAIIHRKEIDKQEGIVYYKVDDVTGAMHEIANKFYDFPSQQLFMYGVTGTNGKSTIMKTVQNILVRLGVKAGYIGTISIEYLDKIIEPDFTTPDIVELNKTLKEMLDAGVSEVCLEVSSQGLDLRRVEGIDFDLAAFTNLSHEHLDYHKTMENYFAAKEILFNDLKECAPMIINIDDPYGQRLTNRHPKGCISYGTRQDADYRADDISLNSSSTEFTLVHKGIHYPVFTNFVAHFNVINMLAVIAILHQRGFALETIIAQLKDIDQVSGRLSKVDIGQDFDVYVDFAHTPDAMEKVYDFVRSTLNPSNKLITVYGSAGERDHLKRPIVGKIGSDMCDWVILSEDDVHREELESINKDVLKGFTNDNYEVIADREEAITKAIKMAKAGDAVVILGKGEDKYIYRKNGKEPWLGDHVVALKVLEEKNNGLQ